MACIVPASTVHDLGIYVDADLSMRTHVLRMAGGVSPPFTKSAASDG